MTSHRLIHAFQQKSPIFPQKSTVFLQKSPTFESDYTAMISHSNALLHTATHCNTLYNIHIYRYRYTGCVCSPAVTTHFNTLHHNAGHWIYTNVLIYLYTYTGCVWSPVMITHCTTMQHTATHCNTLQHTATHCNTLQHTTTHYNALNVHIY